MAIFKYVDDGGNAYIVSQNLPTYLIHYVIEFSILEFDCNEKNYNTMMCTSVPVTNQH